MRPIGFSTGALGFGDTALALRKLEGLNLKAIEFSALREHELAPLIQLLNSGVAEKFDYVSVHAPAKFSKNTERYIVERLSPLCQNGWPIVLHPDAVHDFGIWRDLGSAVLVENMDKRKPVGRSVGELEAILREVPKAGVCFDFAHARQYDPSMTEAYLLLTNFADLIQQVHLSEVPTNSQHDRISPTAAVAYKELAGLLPANVPVILETPVDRDQISAELEIARFALSTWDSGSLKRATVGY